MNNSKLTPAGIVILASGAVMLVASFLDFWSKGSFGENAWSGDLFFPVTIIPVLCGVVMAVHVALTAFGSTNLPPRVAGFRWNQIHLALGFQAAIMMIAFLLQDRSIALGFGLGSVSVDLGAGYWLMLLSGLGLAVGAVMRTREPAAAI
jgi:hypothetical protein